MTQHELHQKLEEYQPHRVPTARLPSNPIDQRESRADGSQQVFSTSERHAGSSTGGWTPDRRIPAMPRWKRLMDTFGSLIGLVVFFPFFLIVGIYIKATSPGPVFFRQRRIGYLGRPFTMWKFRTMTVGADTAVHERYVRELLQNEGQLRKLDRDAQLIPSGHWLRKLCIDELPQLINVLCGSMSLVGPRPDVAAMEQYPHWQQRRFDVLPGMTGLWQVSGKNSTTHERMVELDIAYASQRSMLMDIKILLKTLPVIAGQMSDKSTS